MEEPLVGQHASAAGEPLAKVASEARSVTEAEFDETRSLVARIRLLVPEQMQVQLDYSETLRSRESELLATGALGGVAAETLLRECVRVDAKRRGNSRARPPAFRTQVILLARHLVLKYWLMWYTPGAIKKRRARASAERQVRKTVEALHAELHARAPAGEDERSDATALLDASGQAASTRVHELRKYIRRRALLLAIRIYAVDLLAFTGSALVVKSAAAELFGEATGLTAVVVGLGGALGTWLARRLSGLYIANESNLRIENVLRLEALSHAVAHLDDAIVVGRVGAAKLLGLPGAGEL